jgi:hypothetical protein
MQCDQRFEISHESCVSTESEAGIEKLLLCNDAQFVESHRLQPCPFVLGELRKRRSPPTRESLFQQFDCHFQVRGRARSLAQLLETTGVDHLIWNQKYIPRWTSDDLGLGAKCPTQSREMALQNTQRIGWKDVAP